MNLALQKTFSKVVKQARLILLLSIFSEILLKFLLIIRQRVGWDEFYFLSIIHSFKRNEISQPFQTFHVHLLGWLEWISTNEVTQVIAARCFLFLLFIASSILLYRIARKFTTDIGALFSVFCWLSLSNVINHGASLRADSFCTFLFLLACFGLLTKKRTPFWAIVAGIAMGISLLISIKAAIHLISILALLTVLYVVTSDKRQAFLKASYFSTLLILTFVLGFAWHRAMLLPVAQLAEQDYIIHTSSAAIAFTKLFPSLEYFYDTMRKNPAIWWLLGVGIFFTILDLSKNYMKKGLIPLAFLIPLLSLPFYRNAFPYFYFFIIAPAVIFCSVLPQRILRDFESYGSRILLMYLVGIWLTIASCAGIHFIKAFGQQNTAQTELLNVVHKMFPDPVHYIDGCSAVASYTKTGFFMSTWGFEKYLATGRPIFREILQKHHPQFLLADTPHLNLKADRKHEFFKINHDFFLEDRKILEENYVKFWGMIWLPGKTFPPNQTVKEYDFEVLIPGPYVVETDTMVILDNQQQLPGQRIVLKVGKHTIEPFEPNQRIVLRWDGINYRPDYRAPAMSTFYGF